ITKCSSPDCSSISTTTEVNYDNDNVGAEPSIAIGTDGYPIISYIDSGGSPTTLLITKCSSLDCTSISTTTEVSYNNESVGAETSIAIGIDGYPVIAYRNLGASPDSLLITKCSSIDCTSISTTTEVSYGGLDIGKNPSIVIGADGYPVIAHSTTTATSLLITKGLGLPQTAISYFNRYIKTDAQTKLTRTAWTAPATTGAMFLEASPAIEDGLGYFTDKAGYTSVSANDTSYDAATSTGWQSESSTSTPVFVFSDKHATNTYALTPTWIGQSTVGASTRNITLQTYRFGSTSTETRWVTVSTTDTCIADNDCTITTSATTTDVTDYYYPYYKFNPSTGTTSAEFWTFWRVYQEGGNQTLKTDYWDLATQPIVSTITQRSYIFENDDGSTVNTNSDMNASNTTTTDVQRGQRMVARFQIDNTGLKNFTNKTLRIQYDKNDNNWQELFTYGTTSQSFLSLGLSGTSSDALNATAAGDCTAGATWQNGAWYEYTTSTEAITLNSNICTELAFVIQTATSTLSETYRLRLYNDTDDQVLDSYETYPAFVIVATSSDTKRYSKNVALGVGDDLSEKLEPDWGDDIYIRGVAVDEASSTVYVGGSSGKFGMYDINTGLFTDLTSKISAYVGSSAIYALVYDPDRSDVYIGAFNGEFVQYDPSTETATDQTDEISGF
ncbi:MAG: hypothetical protein ACXABY_34235, partial [Candidatus Thorarchaeota archaeon]